MIAHFQLLYLVTMLWTLLWLKSNKISINADKTKYMLISYNKNVNSPDISVGNNTINENSVTKFLGIYLNKKFNFVNHITEMCIKIAKSIGLLYKLNRFLPETSENVIYFAYSSRLIIWYRGMAWNISK